MGNLFDTSSVSKIGLGTWQLGLKGWGSEYEERELIEALRFGIKSGLNLIDTAEIYGGGKSETLVGEALRDFERKEYFVATKLAGFNASASRVRKSLTNSLKRLKLDHVDLYQVHWEPSIYTSITELFRELERVTREGMIGHIGVSNFSSRSIDIANSALKDLKIESNQIKFNLVERPDKKLIETMKTNNIKLIAWSPLAQGFLSGRYSAKDKPSGTVRKINKLFSSSNFEKYAPFMSELRRISEERKISIIQLVLAYEKHLDVVPIPGFRNAKQVSEMVSANSIKLTEPEISSIETSLKVVGAIETTIGFYPRILPNFIARLGFLFI
jgi:aryl-alcohol dehydrogenase-like predicted oxidoreductase